MHGTRDNLIFCPLIVGALYDKNHVTVTYAGHPVYQVSSILTLFHVQTSVHFCADLFFYLFCDETVYIIW